MPETPEQFDPLDKVKKEEVETQTKKGNMEVPMAEEELNLVEKNIGENEKNLEMQKEKIEGQEERQIESMREQIAEKNEKEEAERKIDLVKHLRRPRNFDARPVELTAENKVLISDMAENSEKRLEKNYEPGYGVFPAADPKENFYEQIWTRDFGHASGNYFANKEPRAIADSLNI